MGVLEGWNGWSQVGKRREYTETLFENREYEREERRGKAIQREMKRKDSQETLNVIKMKDNATGSECACNCACTKKRNVGKIEEEN